MPEREPAMHTSFDKLRTNGAMNSQASAQPARPEPVEGRAPHRPNPRIMILCGRSPRHLYVANRLCQTA
jgi:hypothetical protein